MLNNNIDKIEKAAGTFENAVSSTKFYKVGSHPIKLYVKGDREYRADVLFNNVDVIGFLYVYEDILTKAFLVKRGTNLSTGVRTVTTVNGSCFKVCMINRFWRMFSFLDPARPTRSSLR